LTRELNVRE